MQPLFFKISFRMPIHAAFLVRWAFSHSVGVIWAIKAVTAPNLLGTLLAIQALIPNSFNS
jgi:hypothetical protein